jgi:hypothetical protein
MYSRLAELDARVRHRLADLLGEALDVPLDDALLGQVFLVGLLYEALFRAELPSTVSQPPARS